MPLSYILQQVAYKMGLTGYQTDSGQRAVLLRFVNEAAIELYQQSDMAGCLEEQYFAINGNQEISLPEYVGQVRAMRQADTQIAIKLSQMRPRYNDFNWEDGWRNFRIKNQSALQQSIKNQSVVTISVAQVENPPIVVTISGSSDSASSISEQVTMTSLNVNSINQYNDITSVTKNTVNTCNVTITDVDNNILTVIPNNKLEAKYQIVDVSLMPWLCTSLSPQGNWVEVLYKKSLPWFQNDGDEFPAKGYDNIIVNKVLQLWYEEQGNVQSAVAYMSKATQSLAQIHEDANRGTADVVSLCEHGHDKMNHRVGFGRDWHYAYRIIGR